MDTEKVSKLEEEQLDNVQGGFIGVAIAGFLALSAMVAGKIIIDKCAK